jgi:hypothetical protein
MYSLRPRFTRAFLVLLIGLAGLVPTLHSKDRTSTYQGEDLEHFLKVAEGIEFKEIGQGVTNPLKVTLELDGVRRYAVFKSIDVFEPGAHAVGQRWEFGFQDSYKTEVAAYQIDRLLGLGMVPATVERLIDGKRGSLQLWVDVLMSEADRMSDKVSPPDALGWSCMTTDYALFDSLIDNADRHLNNLLITTDWEIALIDHSRSFRWSGELRNPEKLMRFSTSRLEAITSLDADQISESVGKYLSAVQIKGLLKRRDLILELSREQVIARGELVVLYP